jgi:hypothetical protein
VMFPWRRAEDPSNETFTAFAIFPCDTKYFDPTNGGAQLSS